MACGLRHCDLHDFSWAVERPSNRTCKHHISMHSLCANSISQESSRWYSSNVLGVQLFHRREKIQLRSSAGISNRHTGSRRRVPSWLGQRINGSVQCVPPTSSDVDYGSRRQRGAEAWRLRLRLSLTAYKVFTVGICIVSSRRCSVQRGRNKFGWQIYTQLVNTSAPDIHYTVRHDD